MNKKALTNVCQLSERGMLATALAGKYKEVLLGPRLDATLGYTWV